MYALGSSQSKHHANFFWIFFFLLVIDDTIENDVHSRIRRQERKKFLRPGEAQKQSDRLQVVDRLVQHTQNSDVIKHILSRNPNDYYGILGLDKRATWSDVHKAYSKLNLLVHPDKNKSPDATKATQMLNKARDELRKILLDQSNIGFRTRPSIVYYFVV